MLTFFFVAAKWNVKAVDCGQANCLVTKTLPTVEAERASANELFMLQTRKAFTQTIPLPPKASGVCEKKTIQFVADIAVAYTDQWASQKIKQKSAISTYKEMLQIDADQTEEDAKKIITCTRKQAAKASETTEQTKST